MKYARVIFNGSTRVYDYKTDIPDLKKGDYAVVNTRGEFNVVKVYEIGDSTIVPPENLKWLVCKVDTFNYEIHIQQGD